MSQPTLPMEGGCRCGKLRFRVTAPPMLTMACHCKGCQRMTGAPYSLTAMIPGGGFEIIAGEPVSGGLPGSPHFHCGACMSWVFTRPPTPMPMVNLRPTMLDDASWFTPYAEMCADEKLPWATTPAVKSYPQFPPMDAWQGLIGEYMAQG